MKPFLHVVARPILLLIVALAVSCGPSAREKTLRASLITVNAAKDGFVTWDQERKNAIVAEATSYEVGESTLTAYIEEREKVLLSFELAYKAIATAAVAGNDDLTQMLSNLQALWQALEMLTGKKFP